MSFHLVVLNILSNTTLHSSGCFKAITIASGDKVEYVRGASDFPHEVYGGGRAGERQH